MTHRLDRLLKIRRAGQTRERGRWDQARQEFGERSGEAGAKAASASEATEQLKALGRGELNLARLRLGGEGREALRVGAEHAMAAARDAERRAEEQRSQLERAHRDVRAIEKLTERNALTAKARVAASETRESDDRPRAARP